MHMCKYADVADISGEVIAVVHSKGGAGKTSLTFNLAHAVADTGAGVLVIDLDTQMGQRAFLGDASPDDPTCDVGAVLTGYCEPDAAIMPDIYPNLDVMSTEEQSIDAAWRHLHTPEGRRRLTELLDRVRARYDVVLIDTPGHQSPSLGAVLNASDGVLIPMPPEAGPVAELPTILNAVADSGTRYGRPEVYGVIRTRVWGNSIYRRVAEDQIRTIANQYSVPLFRNKVPEDAKFGEAHLVGMPVGAYHPRARSAVAYRYVAYELIDRRGWPFEIPGDL
jgi:chromosome partitioning protein